jgi:hypothetical protein
MSSRRKQQQSASSDPSGGHVHADDHEEKVLHTLGAPVTYT